MTGRDSAPRRGGMVRNIIHLALGQAATTVLTILLNATLARMLSAPEFGLLFLVMSIATFAYVIVDWGHGNLIIREAARHPEQSGELMGSAFALRTAGAVLASAVAIVTTWLLGYDVTTRLLSGALILCWLPQYLGLSLGWVFRARERMDRDAQINVVLKVATLILSAACLALGGRLLGLVLVWAVAGLLTLVIGIAMWRTLHLPPLSATTTTARMLLRDGAPIFMMALAMAVEPVFNANILYKMASPQVIAWYGAAWTIAGTLLAPATVLSATLYPRMATVPAGPEFKLAFETSFRPFLLLAVLGAVGTYLFADVPIALIYSMSKFAPAADTLRAFAPVLLLMYVDIFLGVAILVVGKAGKLAIAKVAAVVLTTGLVFVLVPITQARFANGGLGVMYAMACGELWMLVANGLLIREVIDGHMLGDICRSLVAGVATIVLFRLLPAFTPFLAIPLCVLAFAGLSLLVGAANRADVEVLLASFRNRRARRR